VGEAVIADDRAEIVSFLLDTGEIKLEFERGRFGSPAPIARSSSPFSTSKCRRL
jgi:hypothetical protein